MKVTAIAYPIQGIVKYHGIRDWKQVIPFHDSISVCMSALNTVTTVEIQSGLKRDKIIIQGREAKGEEVRRVEAVLNAIRNLACSSDKVKVVSRNNIGYGKGLGFSSSAFASLGLAASEAYNLKLKREMLSELVRLGSGSATKSLVGGFAIWYAEREGKSYSEQLASPEEIPLHTIIIPIHSPVRTIMAHEEAPTSVLFDARLRYISRVLEEAKEAIKKRDIEKICKIAEIDTLNLHAVTMTGKTGMILWQPLTIKLIKEVFKMRNEGIPVWFSIDSGPSVFLNTYEEYVNKIVQRLGEMGIKKPIVSTVGPEAKIIEQHLF